MKFLLILIFTISLSTSSYGDRLKDMFKSIVTSQELVERDNKFYTKKDSELYSGKVNDKHKNGKTSFIGQYKNGMKIGKFITYHDNGQIKKKENYLLGTLDGLFKVYDKEGYVEKLKYFIKGKTLEFYESHQLIIKGQNVEFRKGDWWDDDLNTFRLMTIIDKKTQKTFSGEYVRISNVIDDFIGTLIYNFKDGKVNGKVSEFTENGFRTFRGEYKDGMEHGLSEYVERTKNNKIILKEVGHYKSNKKHGIWVTTFFLSGKQKKEIWVNGINKNKIKNEKVKKGFFK